MVVSILTAIIYCQYLITCRNYSPKILTFAELLVPLRCEIRLKVAVAVAVAVAVVHGSYPKISWHVRYEINRRTGFSSQISYLKSHICQ